MTYPRELLPNLFIPGAARCGTSTLHAHLDQHPDIFMSVPKEPHYLCREDKGLGDYRRIFNAAGGFKYRGESSTSYLLFSEVIAKIQQFMPDSRFILMFRNPVDRAWSHYWHIRGGSGAERAGFRDAFQRSIDEPFRYTMYNRQYHNTGLYAHWLTNYLEAFGTDQVHVVVLEELNADSAAILHNLCSFLEIDGFESNEIGHINAAGITRFPIVLRAYAYTRRLAARTLIRPLPDGAFAKVVAGNRQFHNRLLDLLGQRPPPRIGDEDRRWVAGFYRDEVQRLREMTGQSLASWTDFPQ